MAREYRNAAARTSGPQVVEKFPALGARVSVELPVSVAEVIDGMSEEVERFTGEAGLLIMKARGWRFRQTQEFNAHIRPDEFFKELVSGAQSRDAART